MNTTVAVKHLEGNDLLNFVVEYAFEHESEITDLSLPIQTAYFISNFEAEFYNGGIHQFLTNSSGRYTQETARGFTRIGAKQIASLLEESMALDAGMAFKNESLAKALEEINSELRQLYPSNEDGNVGDQLSDYLQQNKSSILVN